MILIFWGFLLDNEWIFIGSVVLCETEFPGVGQGVGRGSLFDIDSWLSLLSSFSVNN